MDQQYFVQTNPKKIANDHQELTGNAIFHQHPFFEDPGDPKKIEKK